MISTPNHHRCLPFCKLEVDLNQNFIHQEGWVRERIRPESKMILGGRKE